LERCQVCGEHSPLISGKLGVCLSCIRGKPEEALRRTDRIHAESRGMFGFPAKPPKDSRNFLRRLLKRLQNRHRWKRFCGLVFNTGGRLVRMGGTPDKGILCWYYDPLPTNCVAWWFCPGCTGAGYPKYVHRHGAETGYANFAVFYGACSFDCLYC